MMHSMNIDRKWQWRSTWWIFKENSAYEIRLFNDTSISKTICVLMSCMNIY